MGSLLYLSPRWDLDHANYDSCGLTMDYWRSLKRYQSDRRYYPANRWHFNNVIVICVN